MSKVRSAIATAAVMLLSLPIGCVHAGSGGPDGDPNVITEEDIARVNVRTAYDAIVRLNGNFLSHRGATSVLQTSNPDPYVWLDDVFLGSVSQLKGIPARDVASIRLYRAWEAATKFGAGYMGGVIEVYTKH